MKRLLKIVLAIVAIGAAAVVTLLLLLLRDHYTEVTLPAPSGSFAVGRATDVWRDDTRELPIWIWYPAVTSADAKPADYVPRYWLDALGRRPQSRIGAVMSTLLSRDAARVHPHSIVDAPVATAQSTYPVVILRGGLGAWTTDYTTLAEDLVSHGYVVVGFDAPGRTGVVVFPDGRIVERPPENNPETVSSPAAAVEIATKLLNAWVRDVGFVVDRLERLNTADREQSQFADAVRPLAGRLNVQALGVAGHSLGGSTALQFCHDDTRCRAGIDIDGRPLGSVVKDSLRQPFMFLLGDHGRENDPEAHQVGADIQSIYDRLPAETRSMITIPGANHFSFSDQMVTRPQTAMKLAQMAGVLRLEPRQGLAIAADHVRRFFDARLTREQSAGGSRNQR
jgi:predicted dienelactone hydrolase